jgi:hypothetical protein
VRDLTDAEYKRLRHFARHYVALKDEHLRSSGGASAAPARSRA